MEFIVLGFAAGLRCMTPIAVICWFAWLGRLPVQGTWAFWAGNLVSVIVFTVAAMGEWIGDTLPNTPNRTAAGPAISRLVFGALASSIAATAFWEPVAGGIIFGVIGAAAGTWGGFYIRRYLSQKFTRDLPVALFGSMVALAMSLYAASGIARGIHKMLFRLQ